MTPSITLSAAPDRLPIGALLALAMTGFICIVTETLPAGLLPLISEGLAISPSMAGQMVTAYALGSVLAVIPMTIAPRDWRRRNVLLLIGKPWKNPAARLAKPSPAISWFGST